MSAPGAGKTIAAGAGAARACRGVRVGVLEGDVAGSLDADRLSRLHVPVTQLNTDQGFGGECHLDANMVRSALPEVPLDEIDLLVIENVGNLVCPAEFRVGEDARAMVCSVTEGEDKPLKYPLMFRACELVVVNKIDLLPHLDFDLDRAAGQPRRGQPGRADACSPAPARARASTGCATGWWGWRPGSASRPDVRPSRRPPTAAAFDEAFFGRGGADRAPLPRDGRAVRARRAPGGAGRARRGALRRAPRGGRVRPPGDRRQAGPAGDRAHRPGPGRRGRPAGPPGGRRDGRRHATRTTRTPPRRWRWRRGAAA